MDNEKQVEELFREAILNIKNLQLDYRDRSYYLLYAYFKQGLEGNVSFEQPSILNMRSRNCWKAWKKIENMPKIEAKKNYIKIVYNLLKNRENLKKT